MLVSPATSGRTAAPPPVPPRPNKLVVAAALAKTRAGGGALSVPTRKAPPPPVPGEPGAVRAAAARLAAAAASASPTPERKLLTRHCEVSASGASLPAARVCDVRLQQATPIGRSTGSRQQLSAPNARPSEAGQQQSAPSGKPVERQQHSTLNGRPVERQQHSAPNGRLVESTQQQSTTSGRPSESFPCGRPVESGHQQSIPNGRLVEWRQQQSVPSGRQQSTPNGGIVGESTTNGRLTEPNQQQSTSNGKLPDSNQQQLSVSIGKPAESRQQQSAPPPALPRISSTNKPVELRQQKSHAPPPPPPETKLMDDEIAPHREQCTFQEQPTLLPSLKTNISSTQTKVSPTSVVSHTSEQRLPSKDAKEVPRQRSLSEFRGKPEEPLEQELSHQSLPHAVVPAPRSIAGSLERKSEQKTPPKDAKELVKEVCKPNSRPDSGGAQDHAPPLLSEIKIGVKPQQSLEREVLPEDDKGVNSADSNCRETSLCSRESKVKLTSGEKSRDLVHTSGVKGLLSLDQIPKQAHETNCTSKQLCLARNGVPVTSEGECCVSESKLGSAEIGGVEQQATESKGSSQKSAVQDISAVQSYSNCAVRDDTAKAELCSLTVVLGPSQLAERDLQVAQVVTKLDGISKISNGAEPGEVSESQVERMSDEQSNGCVEMRHRCDCQEQQQQQQIEKEQRSRWKTPANMLPTGQHRHHPARTRHDSDRLVDDLVNELKTTADQRRMLQNGFAHDQSVMLQSSLQGLPPLPRSLSAASTPTAAPSAAPAPAPAAPGRQLPAVPRQARLQAPPPPPLSLPGRAPPPAPAPSLPPAQPPPPPPTHRKTPPVTGLDAQLAILRNEMFGNRRPYLESYENCLPIQLFKGSDLNR
ncbi:uncharacterized protein LOC126195619 [Schistocerca nitens]|uniref:uncharacterized protein LOC126195619 n=1 Tax=Schistocerca nitens TaxID=7011 RepID=UPI002117CC66|nr:uncharacterized protein LOC126195619 [Schistocerca nitens]